MGPIPRGKVVGA